MKIALIPLDIKAADIHENLISAAERLRYVQSDTDIVVLPEMFTTGFVKDRDRLRELAETNSGHTMDDVHRWATYFRRAIAGSFIARDQSGSRFYNRAFFVEPSGDETFYDKHHLFTYGGEHEVYCAGQELPPVIRYMGWNISMGICYDLRFPEWLRNVAGRYDLMLLPASWPQSRRLAWDTLLKARAIENQAYIAGANRSGTEGHERFSPDSSMVYDFMGRQAGEADPSGIVHAGLDIEALRKFRRSLPALADQDPFELTGLD